ncbi:sulfite exporter TauE/SafE family protein [Bradyrhizobium cenepequi]
MFDLTARLSDLAASASLTPAVLMATSSSVLAAALLRGFTGFGFALAAVPLLGMFMPPSQSVPIAICLQFLGGALDFPRARHEGHWPSLRWLIIGAAAGSPVGALALSVVPASVARILIAAITIAAVMALNGGARLAQTPSRMMTTLVGLICGLFNGLAAMPGPPVVMYYMSGPFGRVATRASLMVFFLATSIAALISTALVGLLDERALLLSLLALPIMLAGTWIGEQAFRRGSDALHRQVSIASLGLIAIGSAIKGVSELM